jgi:hypothetical protein
MHHCVALLFDQSFLYLGVSCTFLIFLFHDLNPHESGEVSLPM